jgi:CMP-N-acetylneuraminic acid synthetase
MKISVLKRVKNISKIIVSSSNKELMEIARKNGSDVHERDAFFSTSETSGSELYKCLAEAVESDDMMYVTCVSPFVRPETYEQAIDVYFRNKKENIHDSVVSCKNVKEFLWLHGKPINYDPKMAPPSQLLPDIYELTFGFNIIGRNYVENNGSIVGESPYMYEVSELEAVDIDTPFDFTVAELLYSNAFKRDEDITSHNILTCHTEHKFSILDCTVRDGGYLNNWDFKYEEVLEMYRVVSKTCVDFFEIGFICNSFGQGQEGRWWNVSENDIAMLKYDFPNGCKIAAMIHFEDISKLDRKIPELDMIRVLVNPRKAAFGESNRGTLKKILDMGYRVTINIAYIDILDAIELNSALELVIPGIEYVYIADTFGSMDAKAVKTMIRYIKQKCDVKIGFHGHNNTQQAILNSIVAIKSGATIIDVTIQGKGRGGGNTQLELFLQHANHEFGTQFNMNPVLEYLDNVLTFDQKLGILHTLTGLKKIHPNKANESLEHDSSILKCYQNIVGEFQ